MQWEDREERQHVEDRRGQAVKAGVAIGGGSIVIVLLALRFGVDPQKLGGIINQGAEQEQQQDRDGNAERRPIDPAEEKLAKFTKVIFGDTERVWGELFAQMGKTYQKPTLVLFSGQVESACGSADAAVGPFYCPGDSRVYIDLSFYRDMQTQLKAPGEFARAYVVAHEVGHHVQRLLGYSARVDQARRTMPKAEYNKMSVRLELQADYLAGVWAHHGQKKYNFLDPGDIESALNAAHQIGDDYLQKQSRGRVVPDSFTHGTSAQRMRWFKRGFEAGSVEKARALFELRYEEL
jgi:predicted metalloprotease